MPASIGATVAGHTGALRYGYHEVARLSGWRLTMAPRVPRTYEISASRGAVDEYWLSARPLTVSLAVGDATWEWGNVEIRHCDPAQISMVVQGLPTVIRWVGGVQ